MVKKRFPQGGGVGGRSFLGEETGKMDGTKGTIDQGPETVIARVGDWIVVIGASHLRLLLLCAGRG